MILEKKDLTANTYFLHTKGRHFLFSLMNFLSRISFVFIIGIAIFSFPVSAGFDPTDSNQVSPGTDDPPSF